MARLPKTDVICMDSGELLRHVTSIDVEAGIVWRAHQPVRISLHTRNAQLAGDAAACRDLADQHQRLAALAAEGAAVVGELGGLVKRRDAQVDLLRGQVAVDRALIDQLQ